MKSEEIQQEILKILFALKEMNSSLTIMASSWEAGRPLNPTMLQTLVEEIHKLLQKTIGLSSSPKVDAGTPIIQCKQQSAMSSYSDQQQTKESKPSFYQIKVQSEANDPPEIDIIQLVSLNHELSQENQELTKRLEEAGARILALQDEQANNESAVYRSRDEDSLTWENRKLKIELDKVEQLLVVNNQQFIEEIQKYNEKLWKMERQIEAYKCKNIEQRGLLQEKDFVISKLKLKNMDLQMTSRSRIKFKSESKPPTQRTKREFSKVQLAGTEKEIHFPKQYV